jgi:hypothetical protein
MIAMMIVWFGFIFFFQSFTLFLLLPPSVLFPRTIPSILDSARKRNKEREKEKNYHHAAALID